VRGAIVELQPPRYAADKGGESAMSDEIRARFWGRQMDDVMSEMARQATVCKVRLLDPGVIDAVLRNDESVCGTSNPLSFKKLRDVMMLGFIVRDKSVDKVGAMETEALVAAIRERIKEHLGGQLGGPG
jgi:hypothetical protein